MKDYVGNPLQVRGAEQYILQNGKGDGMHFLYIRNGLGLELWLSIDRCADVSRLSFKGDNMCFFSPCGYVSPKYYDKEGSGFLKSFTGGFLTTCGLNAVGAACEDNGEKLPLHGTVSNIPAELNCIEETEKGLTVKFKIRDAVLFGQKLVMNRVYFFSYTENYFTIDDSVVNEGDNESPYMILYHCNMGYPLLSENSIVKLPNYSYKARDEQAEKYVETAQTMEKPQKNYAECCYYYDIKETDGIATVGIMNEEIGKGLTISYDKKALPCFTEWKMMGKTDYALGLEPGNCNPDGRDIVRKQGKLQFIQPDEVKNTSLKFTFFTDKNKFEGEF